MIEVELDYETSDRITILALRDALGSLERHAARIRQLKDMTDIQLKDLIDDLKLIEHIRAVLVYFGDEL